MSYTEYTDWLRYAEKNGPIIGTRRIEMSIAYAALNFSQAMFKKKSGEPFKLTDFLLWQEAEPEQYGTAEDVFKLIKSVATGDRKDGS